MRFDDLSPADQAAIRGGKVSRYRDRSVATGSLMVLTCSRCGVEPTSDAKRTLHAEQTGHIRFQWRPDAQA